MANQNYKIFPNKVELFKFFGKYNDTINVGASARLPINGLAIGNKMQAYRTFPEFYAALAELTGLDIDTKASTVRMGTYIIFFNKEQDLPGSEVVAAEPIVAKNEDGEIIGESVVQPPQEDTNPSIEAILIEAAALNDEDDKQGSKAKLIDFAASKNIVLKGNKGFDKLLADFEAALKA
ncbi:hypothetical protein pEaSNUABM55_00051 [Erwinia phage pEa_SNUABM_55]|nr:hypothetical protein pEaSNUABM55_00051 [Erwinia phage pEa_SNUABM_55]